MAGARTAHIRNLTVVAALTTKRHDTEQTQMKSRK
jgi:hypothetical protein